MKKKFILAVTFVFAACAPQGASHSDLQRFEKKLNDVRSFQAEQNSELSALQEEVRILTGRLEQVEYRAGVGVSAIGGRPKSPAPSPVIPHNSVVAANTPPAIVPLEPLEEDEARAPHLDVQVSRLFQDALYFVRRGQYRQAIPLLDQIIAFSGQKEGHLQSLFWKGVCYDGMGNNREALSSYNALIQAYPSSPRARLGLLRLASVFIRIGDTNTARLTLQKLVAEAPRTPEAEAAKKKLADLQ